MNRDGESPGGFSRLGSGLTWVLVSYGGVTVEEACAKRERVEERAEHELRTSSGANTYKQKCKSPSNVYSFSVQLTHSEKSCRGTYTVRVLVIITICALQRSLPLLFDLSDPLNYPRPIRFPSKGLNWLFATHRVAPSGKSWLQLPPAIRAAVFICDPTRLNQHHLISFFPSTFTQKMDKDLPFGLLDCAEWW
ncbi:hypothetical protein CEK26_004948 [Fusarium fujikuroi]|uniref:Uncharacterized protein n=1 Tax=Fusarium fujikuroi TaxID=5127 RepID=A0A5Q3D3P7_FUSFU|nr:hypothetical protein CEK27_004949 [Fusarium fujikuroi]QGI78162.1 hypothetical protein CEK25_004891 [Fusarium fujikuroi]QGI91879.1 hypothetical protein CEK26_004948 [Fusarium fujikuroi]VTT55627.1 unnamed protein product [Fusarium fujikuroi]VTT70046.1 unnamed protein product [Fusarium fujikuroi]